MRFVRPLFILGALFALALFITCFAEPHAGAYSPALARAKEARPHMHGPGGTAATPNPSSSPHVVLYDQYDNPGLTGTSSQVFGPNVNYYDDQAADDFVVPGGQVWTVDLVEVEGTY